MLSEGVELITLMYTYNVASSLPTFNQIFDMTKAQQLFFASKSALNKLPDNLRACWLYRSESKPN